MKKTRQQIKSEEKQRINKIIQENENFVDIIKKRDLKYLTDTNLLEMEILGFKREIIVLKEKNAELSKEYQKKESTEREKEFIDGIGKQILKVQNHLIENDNN